MNTQTDLTLASVEQIAAQATLMTGLNQFSLESDAGAEQALEGLIAHERLYGNKRLLKIYDAALAELRRRG